MCLLNSNVLHQDKKDDSLESELPWQNSLELEHKMDVSVQKTSVISSLDLKYNMEVSGRRDEKIFRDTIGKSSAEDGDTFCQPCCSDGDWVVAVGYCQNCTEYFCTSCLKVHRKQSVSKNHVILEGGKMPKAKVASVIVDACSELCDRHTNEILRFYCSSHDAIGCCDCMVLDHKTCKVERIHDISTHYFNGQEHRELLRKVDTLFEELDQIKRETRSGEKNSEHSYSKAVDDIKILRKEINDQLDRAEREIMSELTKRKQEDERLIAKLKNDEQIMGQEVAEVNVKLKLQANQANELFVSAKRVQGKIAHFDISIKEMSQNTHIKQYTFSQSPSMKELVASHVPLGEIKEKKHLTELDPEFDCDINIKTVKDKRDCSIFASALLSPSRILLADYKNKCVKIVDIEQRRLTARYELSSEPRDIAVVSPSLIAVCLRNGKIQFLSVTQDNTSSLTENRDIQAGHCYRIACQRDTVLAAYQGSVKIMNTSGVVQKTINASCLTCPEAVAFGAETGTFYVSNSFFEQMYVCKFSCNGGLVAKYEDKKLSGVRGLTVIRDGTVFVCNWANNGSIHMISPDCKKIKETLRESKHVKYPYAVSFCESTNRMFLCNNEASQDPELKNVLKIFQMK